MVRYAYPGRGLKYGQGSREPQFEPASRSGPGIIFVIQDADLEYDPADWTKMYDLIAVRKVADVVYGSRFYGRVHRSLAAWNTKYTYNTWRLTVIQNADSFTNAAIIQNPNWQSQIIAPPFPEYISGHSTFSAAVADILPSFFGNCGGVCRMYADSGRRLPHSG
jgi:hypothetical protein